MKSFIKNLTSFIATVLITAGILSCETSETIIPRFDSFVKLYGNDGNQFGIKIQQLSNSDIVILARVENPLNDYFMLVWVDTLGNELKLLEFQDDNDMSSEIPVAMTVDRNDNILVAGNFIFGSDRDAFIYKISSSGDVLAKDTFDIFDINSKKRIDVVQDIIPFENNSYVISGYSRATQNSADEFFSLRVDEQLNRFNEWKMVIPYLDDNEVSVFNRRSNKILPFGESKIISYITSDRVQAGVKAGTNIEVLIIDNLGNPDYTNGQQSMYSGTDLDDELNSSAFVGSGFAFVGTSKNSTSSSLIVGKVSTNGKTIQNEFFLTERNLTAVDIDQIQNARYIILAEERVSSDNTNMYMAEVNDVNGEIYWEYAYGGEDLDNAAGLLVIENSIFALGSLRLNGQNKILLIKTQSNGRL